MDKQQARNLIKETFENPFDKDRFIGFIKNLLNHIEEATFTYQGQFIPEAYRQYIRTLERIGKFNDGENRIDILVIKLQKETSLERARTMQRNFVAWYLNGSRGGELKEAALVAFVSPDEEDWRFSLVKMDYKFEQTQTGRMKVKEDYTPARRWSFLVGVNENSHTAQSRLVGILANDEHSPTIAELEQAFDIETVTKEFFIEYRELFIRTKEELDNIVTQASSLKNEFESKGVDTVNFAKKLLGQIVFLYFLQKKGWFGVARDAEWGTGSKHFLRELFGKKHGGYKNFFNDILEPLFYEALRIDRSHDDDYYSRFNCKIPFLNGGLFDPIGNYNWVYTDICLPDSLFSNKTKTKEGDEGDGILDIFDRYNFTVREDEPLEKEVAIDPELLGKAYEKFNAIRPDNFEEYKKALKNGNKGEESKFNKQYGVYYTPREIVYYMCQQSLINYLHTVTQASLSACGDAQAVSLRSINTNHKQDACDTASSLSSFENIYYDTCETVAIRRRNLPHWEQGGKAYFVTFRLCDSIPKEAAENIRQERQKWFERNKITNTSEVEKLSRENQIEYYRLFSKRYDELLDNGHGSCALANSDCKRIVEEALSHFNNKRYHLDKYVVMPNHVHVIVIPMESWPLEKILHSWKSYTAKEINKLLYREGELWMHESFDHIIRSPEQLERIRKYIEDNPKVTHASVVTQASSLSNHKQDACVTITKEDIETLIHLGEQVSENEEIALIKEQKILEGKQKSSDYKLKLPESIRKNASLIDQMLADITVCDPAVGSGAFPVGMMSEIVKARNVLSVFVTHASRVTQASSLRTINTNHKQDACDTYNFKRRCIEHSLYGVDIDPGAVEIAKLRLRLSLVVDEDDIKNIKPLPNLDYRIMQGNSLISEFMGINFDDEDKNLERNIEDLGTEIKEIERQIKIKEKEFLRYYNKFSKKDQDTSNKLEELTKRKNNLKKNLIQLENRLNKPQEEDPEITNIISEFQKKKNEFLNESNASRKTRLREEVDDLLIKIFETKLRFQKADYFKRLKNIENKYSALPNKKQRDEYIKQDKEKLYKESGFNLESAEKLLKEFTSGNKIKPFFLWNLYFSEVFHHKGGFDVVIANPPYVQLQKDGGRLANMFKNCGYKTFERTGDIYSLFYEKGINLLKNDAVLTFITSNKWMRAGYGKSLRKFFNAYNPRLLVDLGPGIFESATVDTNILIIEKKKNQGQLAGLTLNAEARDADLSDFISNNKNILPKMGDDAWFIGNQAEQNLKEKIERIGKPLKEWDVNIYRGVLTGLNEAFIVDTATRDRLVAEDPKSAEILKPILRGRDIKRYTYEWAGLWLIASGFDIDVPKNYPAVFRHLKQFEEKAKKRDDQGQNWWNLRACAYYPEFEKEKVVWAEMSKSPSFSYDNNLMYCNDTGRIMTGKRIKFLVAIFNSCFFCNIFSKYYAGGELGEEGIRFKHTFMEKFPISPITLSNKNIVEKIERIVERILSAKKQNPKTDTSQPEREIDQMVYQLYGLTPDEIAIVEGK